MNIFTDKVILVTGGTSGIGLACTKKFLKYGAQVIITGRNKQRASDILNELEFYSDKIEFLQCDISKTSEVQYLFNLIKDKYGQLNGAVNNAGIEGTPFIKLVDYDEAVWDEVIAINLKGAWLCMKGEIEIMLQQKCSGSIVNISSYAGIRASKTGGAAYTASKHGLIGITKSAALEYAKDNIRVNAVCPAVIDTPNARHILGDKLELVASKLHPMGRIGLAHEVANTVVWLCSDKSSFITGESIAIDGGLQA